MNRCFVYKSSLTRVFFKKVALKIFVKNPRNLISDMVKKRDMIIYLEVVLKEVNLIFLRKM